MNLQKPNDGRIGEELVQQFLAAHGVEVTDVSNEPEYWAQDIDFIAQYKGVTKKIEVKYDTYIGRTGNLFLEYITDVENKKPGWFTYTKADELYYIDAQSRIIYVINIDQLRDYVARAYFIRETSAFDYYADGRIKKESRGYLVKLDNLRQYIKIKQYQL